MRYFKRLVLNKLVHKAAVLLAMMCVVAVLPLFAAGSSDKNASENVLDVYSIMPEDEAAIFICQRRDQNQQTSQ